MGEKLVEEADVSYSEPHGFGKRRSVLLTLKGWAPSVSACVLSIHRKYAGTGQ